MQPTIDPSARKLVVTSGLPASPGAASGEIVFTAEDAEAMKVKGRDVILVRPETSPEDIHGMHAAAGILTARGGMTSHAAVVARGMGRPCVTGANALKIDAKAGTLTIGREVLKRGDVITIDGTSGQVMKGRAPLRQPELSGSFSTLMQWADACRTLGVRANLEKLKIASQARDYGAEGIGLCTTEQMFFNPAQLPAIREMICAGSEPKRRAALAKVLPLQRAEFEELLEGMGELPVTIRLFDPPLLEFMPRDEEDQAALAATLGMPISALRSRIAELTELNPMLGLRGCRLSVRYPEITEMQVRAILEAAAAVMARTGKKVRPEIMVPLVSYRAEYDLVAGIIRRVADEVEVESPR